MLVVIRKDHGQMLIESAQHSFYDGPDVIFFPSPFLSPPVCMHHGLICITFYQTYGGGRYIILLLKLLKYITFGPCRKAGSATNSGRKVHSIEDRKTCYITALVIKLLFIKDLQIGSALALLVSV